MKKLLFLLLVTVLSLSCSSDEEQRNVGQDEILGDWKIIAYSDEQYSNIQEVDADEPCFSETIIKYNTNLSLIEYYKYGNNCSNTGSNNKIYSLDGNILTHTTVNGGYEPNTDYVVKYEIQELTSTTLKLKGIYVDEGVSGVPPETEPFYSTWEKQN